MKFYTFLDTIFEQETGFPGRLPTSFWMIEREYLYTSIPVHIRDEKTTRFHTMGTGHTTQSIRLNNPSLGASGSGR